MSKSKLTHGLPLRILLFVGAVALLVYFLPRADKNHYIYEVNRPWKYALLTAPFDIPVHLDSVSAARVKDSIDASFEPVFKRDLALEKTTISEFTERLNAPDGPGISPAQKNQVIKAIKQIYENGIVSREVYARIAAGDLPMVRFLHDHVAISMPTDSYLSAFRAYEHLDSLFKDKEVRSALSATRLSEILQPNILLDTLTTKRLLDESYMKAMAPIDVKQQGERIVDEGELVTPMIATILDTYEEMAEERNQGQLSKHHYPIAGQVLYLVILIGALYGYLYFFRPKFYANDRTIIFLMVFTVVFTLFAFAMNATFRLGIYLVPFTMVPIMVVVFLDSRTAYFTHLIEVLICTLVVTLPLEFVFMQFIAGVTAIDSLKDLSRRSQLLRTAFLIFIAYSLCYASVEVIHTGSLDDAEARVFGALGINAVLISFSYVLMFLIERIFGFTSRVTLVELADTNNPLLRELSEKCPGTFNHSMSVSNLASDAAVKIGANVQLVRTGALYHDIGKIKNPAFFTENQHGVNPHDVLDPMQSARIVTDHVRDGLAMAEKAKLPQAIRNFISQHHGAGKAKYFFNTYANAHPGEQVDPAPFTYPGPDPQSRETSLLMMADSIEAASRSMTDHSPEAITALVNKIIDGQIADGLHNQSPISFRDVKLIKESFIQRLRTMFHSRISYPELKKDAAAPATAESPSTPAQTTDTPTSTPEK